MDREQLGRIVRQEWVRCAQEQPNPKPSHLLPWEEMSEPEREVDRRIGEKIASLYEGQEQQVQKLQEALENSLEMQQEDEQTIAGMRALLDDIGYELAQGVYSVVAKRDDLVEKIRAYLEKHPAPVEGGLEDDDDDE